MAVDSEIEHCYESEYRRLVGVVAVLAGSVTLAEESVQEAFARAVAHSRRGRAFDHLPAWVPWPTCAYVVGAKGLEPLTSAV